MIEEQVSRWERLRSEGKKKEKHLPVITVSREPGSGGSLVAKGIAQQLGFDLFHGEIIERMAESVQMNIRILKTLDEKGRSLLEDWLSMFVSEKHLWPDRYLNHLMKVIGTIGKHGKAVIVGRGANYILPLNEQFRVRILAPLEMRVQNVVREFSVPEEEARRRILRTDSDRRAFIRRYFYADIADPLNYDLLINTGTISVECAVKSVIGALP